MFLSLFQNIKYMSIIPTDFEEWRRCIEKKCGIPLTSDFAKQRLNVYRDRTLPETQRFIKLYGEEHYERIKLWFAEIAGT